MEDCGYIPSEQDWNDFEESYNSLPTFGSQKKWTFSKGSTTAELSRETICTIVTHFLANCTPKESIKTTDLINRLTVMSLFGYNIKELLQIICSDLSKEELSMLYEGKEYPYLLTQLRAVVGDENLEYCREVYKHMMHTFVLPYKQFFDEDWKVTDHDKLQVRYELISIHEDHLRPLWCCRVIPLKEAGISDEAIRSRKVVEVDCVKFLTKLFDIYREKMSDFRWQFGIHTQYIPRSNKMKFVVPKVFLVLLECYFNVKFIDVSERKKHSDSVIVYIPNWEHVGQ